MVLRRLREERLTARGVDKSETEACWHVKQERVYLPTGSWVILQTFRHFGLSGPKTLLLLVYSRSTDCTRDHKVFPPKGRGGGAGWGKGQKERFVVKGEDVFLRTDLQSGTCSWLTWGRDTTRTTTFVSWPLRSRTELLKFTLHQSTSVLLPPHLCRIHTLYPPLRLGLVPRSPPSLPSPLHGDSTGVKGIRREFVALVED